MNIKNLFNNKTINLEVFIFEIIMLLIVTILLFKINQDIRKVNLLNESSFIMLGIADELRQSSDDLTKFAREYVVTNNIKYKNLYFRVLQIRNGKVPRPYLYDNNIYWNLGKEFRQRGHPNGKKLSLNEIIKKLPYDKKELNLLEISKNNSDKLVNLEVKAFNAMVGKFQDKNGKYTIKGNPNQKLAINLLYSDEYLKSKNKIMEPIDKFISMLKLRTKKEIDKVDKAINTLQISFYIILSIFIIGNIYIYFYLRKKDIEYFLKTFEINKKNDDLIESSKAKSEFLANMSHEIRTPLNAIVGFIDILKENIKTNPDKEYLEIVKSSSESLLQIINDILDFSKIESGKLEIDKHPFEPKKEFKTIANLFDAKASEKNINLILNIDKNMPEVLISDPLRIKQIIANLISNAVKFTPEGNKIIISINYKDNKLFISVKDEGIGIAKDKQQHIFEAFSQEDSSTTRKYGGTGLGLSISSKLVELLGGKLNLKSEVGKGSKFYFSIPAEIGKLDKKDKNISENMENLKGKKILVAEDNQANQMFMKILLKKFGFEFEIASDGVEAVEKFKNNKYDFVLMDENMPNMNGIEATKRILEYEKENNLKHTPIIALTANAIKGDRERFLNAGMDEYLTKPLNRKELIKVLNQFVE